MFVSKFVREISGILRKDTCTKYLSSFTAQMAEALEKQTEKPKATKTKVSYKTRYDGRAKKRHWVEFTPRSEEEEIKRAANTEPFERIKRKKCCLLMSYSGVNYFGMQRNPETKTIEEDLLKAMLKNNWITEDAFKQIQTIQFQRAARTDKGVSAARQCVSLKLPDNIDLDALNADLPEQIRVFAIKRVTKGFNSKDQCSARTYTYTVPTIALAPHNEEVDMFTYRFDAAKLIELNEILKGFEGTRNFHNFTSQKEFIDPSSKRFIVQFEAQQPFVMSGVEFCVMTVKGQSFMIHQIRKMVGLALAIFRGLTPITTLERAFTSERLDIPKAPGLGLVLDQVHYDRYNNRYGTDGIHETLEWSSVEDKVKEFFDSKIVPKIVETEIAEKSMATWLETLPIHSYDVRQDLPPRSSAAKADDDDD